MAAWRYEISLLVLKKYFTRSLRSLVKYFSTLEEKFRISVRPCNILYLTIALVIELHFDKRYLKAGSILRSRVSIMLISWSQLSKKAKILTLIVIYILSFIMFLFHL